MHLLLPFLPPRDKSEPKNWYVQFSASAHSDPLTDSFALLEGAQYLKGCSEVNLHRTAMHDSSATAKGLTNRQMFLSSIAKLTLFCKRQRVEKKKPKTLTLLQRKKSQRKNYTASKKNHVYQEISI